MLYDHCNARIAHTTLMTKLKAVESFLRPCPASEGQSARLLDVLELWAMQKALVTPV